MPEVSRFFGIIIAMYYNDHSPPHFHARYGGDQASLRIDNGAILEGNLGTRTQRLEFPGFNGDSSGFVDWSLQSPPG